MKKSYVVIIGVIAIAAVACIAFAKQPVPPGPPGHLMAGPPPMGPPMGPPPPPHHDLVMGGSDEGPLGMLKEELGITDQQKKQMRLLFAAYLDRTRKARMSLMASKDEHRATMLSGSVDLKKLAQIDEQEVKLVSEIMSEKLKMRRDRLALLTPEQVEKFATCMSEKRPPHHMPPPGHPGGKDMPKD